MATINGVEVRALKSFVGREGECWQGTVYLNGKKLGFWSQDSWGGPDQFDFDVSLLDEACKKYEAGFPETYQLKDVVGEPECFISEVATLKDIEASCSKMFKKGAEVVVYMTDSYHASWFGLPMDMPNEQIKTKYYKNMAEIKKEMFKNEDRIAFFRKGDFDITVDKKHPISKFFLDRRYM